MAQFLGAGLERLMKPVFEGPLAKLNRAQRKIRALERDFDRFTGANPYGVYAEFDDESGRHVLRAYARRSRPQSPPRVRWSMDVGEIVYHLRSALDQAVCELAAREEPSWAEKASFPLYRFDANHTPRRVKKPRPARIVFDPDGHEIRPLLAQHKRIIEGVQPYEGEERRRFQCLWLLHEMNNVDKHRSLVDVTAGVFETALTVSGDEVGGYVVHYGAPVEDGAEIGDLFVGSVLSSVRVDGYLAQKICFSETIPALGQREVIPLLNWIARTVEDILHDLWTGEPYRTLWAHIELPSRDVNE